MFCKWASSFIS